MDPRFIAATDLNHDRNLDIIVAFSWCHKISILSYIGNGTFTTYANILTENESAQVIVADINDDEKLDLIVTHSIAGTIGIYFNAGNGKFTDAATYPINTVAEPLAIGDINDNKTSDIIVSSTYVKNESVNIFLNIGNGAFNAKTTYSTDCDSFSVAIVDVMAAINMILL